MLKQFILIGIAIGAFTTFGCENTKILDNVVNKQPTQTAPICEVGDTLKKGQTCQDPGTDAVFSVTENGNGKYTSKGGLLFETTDVLDTIGTTFNDKPYNFKATKQNDGSWKIETVSWMPNP